MFDESIFLPDEAGGEDISFARVAKVGANGLTLRLDGEESPGGKEYRRLASYSPVEGDRVFVLRAGGELLVIGKII